MMTDAEKKLLQAQHRLEEAQARDRVKERKARTRRLIQEGAILEKVLPEVRTMEPTVLEDYLIQKLPQHDSICWEVSGKPGTFLFFLPKGALTHHRVGTNSISFAPPQAAGLIHSVVPPFPTKSTTLWEPFCGGGMPYGIVRSARRMRLLWKPPDNATAPAGAAVIVCAIGQIPSLQPTLFFQPLAQTCHRQL